MLGTLPTKLWEIKLENIPSFSITISGVKQAQFIAMTNDKFGRGFELNRAQYVIRNQEWRMTAIHIDDAVILSQLSSISYFVDA